MERTCPACGTALNSPLVCESCGELLEPEPGLTPFAVFGLEPAAEVAADALRKRLLALTRRTHPDFFGSDPGARRRAESNTAALNEAWDVLSDDIRRANWLLGYLGGPDEKAERDMPQSFLLEVMEWNEAVEEARAAGADTDATRTLTTLEAELLAERTSLVTRIREGLLPLPTDTDRLVELRRLMNAVRYLDRTLHEIAELRLSHASSR